jgi:hypothetical protein
LKSLDYTSPREAIAEKFQMSEALLEALNPGKKFDQAGQTISVVNVAKKEAKPVVARLEVDKTAQTVKALGKTGELIAFFPASVGSDEKPEFLRGAKLEVAVIGDVLRLKIPKACGNARARVYGYNVEVSSPGNAVKLKKSVYANGYSFGDGCEPDRGVTVLSIPKSELPPGKTLAITVHPSSCLASKGKPVTAIFNTVTGAVR